MKNKNLLLVDVSNQIYKASAAHPLLTDRDGLFTGGLYGFMFAIAKAIDDTKATSVCLCLDRKPYIRSKHYPEYKRLRADNKNEELVQKAQTTLHQVHEFAAVLGWPVWGIQGFESDDLIGYAAGQHRHRYDTITAMSNDDDLHQLFKYHNFQLHLGKKGIFKHADYDKVWRGMPVSKLVTALALTGSHNDVAGIKGVGPATAAKLLTGDEDYFTKYRKEYEELIVRNEALIVLPHKDFPREEQMPVYTGEFDERKLLNFCSRYGISLQRYLSELFEKVGK